MSEWASSVSAVAHTAWIDESVRVEHGLYVLAAVIVDDAQMSACRRTLRNLVHQGQGRLHWHSDAEPLRNQSLGVLAADAVQIRPYLSFFDRPKRQEEARVRCLAHLVADIVSPGLTEIVLDRRRPNQDVQDLHLIAQELARTGSSLAPRVRHESSVIEPLLWLADVAAGAAGAHLVRRDASYITAIAGSLVIS